MALNYILLGKRVREIRIKKRMSQTELSELIDKTPPYVSYIESGIKSPSLDTLVLIANALGVTADMLLAESLENHLLVDEAEYAELMDDCSPYERRVLIENARALKKTMREYHFLSKRKNH
ncbi:MAG: helix-turn-helix domain-containing protein [Lachnospiraceae bacterium]|nr:helix-turn-helix domain-containing protein [Lachnospiraceae bacterium]